MVDTDPLDCSRSDPWSCDAWLKSQARIDTFVAIGCSRIHLVEAVHNIVPSHPATMWQRSVPAAWETSLRSLHATKNRYLLLEQDPNGLAAPTLNPAANRPWATQAVLRSQDAETPLPKLQSGDPTSIDSKNSNVRPGPFRLASSSGEEERPAIYQESTGPDPPTEQPTSSALSDQETRDPGNFQLEVDTKNLHM